METVTDLLRIFGNERYMLTYTEGGSSGGAKKVKSREGKKAGAARGIASVILHKNATGADTVKSFLALEYLQEELALAGFSVAGAPPSAQKIVRNGNSRNDNRINGNNQKGVPKKDVAVGGWGKEEAGGGMVESVLAQEKGAVDTPQPSSTELRRCLEAARRRADEGAPGFFVALRALGWSTEKFMFGNIKSRVEWRLP